MDLSTVSLSRRFNPRTHAGCDRAGSGSDAGSATVSIHAPTRGAIDDAEFIEHEIIVSIHAPTRGAIANVVLPMLLDNEFQSTHPRGVRSGAPQEISKDCCFNPRTHAGCDSVARYIFSMPLFQSTHPRGVRSVVGCLG